MTGALGIMTGTIPMIVATWGVIKVMDVTFKNPKTGKPVGIKHYHKKPSTGKLESHQHTYGGRKHEHRGLRGYGRTREAFKIKR